MIEAAVYFFPSELLDRYRINRVIRVQNASTFIGTDNWVRETRIGTWFLGTEMWRRHVLPEAIVDLRVLLDDTVRTGRLLDIGCGQGHSFRFIGRLFRPDYLLGIDVDPELVERGKSLATRCSCPTEVRQGDATNLDLPDSSVDTIFCHQTFHHLADQEAAAAEFFRILVPGGRLLFAESCRSFIYSWRVRLFFRHPMHVQKTAQEYDALLRKTGFEFSARHVSTPYPSWSRPDFGILEALGRPIQQPRDAPLVCIVATKPE